jgi:hypothetical protein
MGPSDDNEIAIKPEADLIFVPRTQDQVGGSESAKVQNTPPYDVRQEPVPDKPFYNEKFQRALCGGLEAVHNLAWDIFEGGIAGIFQTLSQSIKAHFNPLKVALRSTVSPTFPERMFC